MQSSTFHRNALASALAFVLFSPVAVHAQQTEPEAPQAEATDSTQEQTEEQGERAEARTLDAVTVTGSRIKRSEVEGPAPVTVITGEQIKREGFTTVHEALSNLTEVTGTVEPDYNWGQRTVNASPLNLRNLGPGRSLLLINGRRVADYPLPYQGKSNFANYNNIPTGVVDRIEVLSGSASAIYGSDAMAGVVNVILKKDFEGDIFRASYGTTTRGGRTVRDASWSGGKTGDNWSISYTMQYFDRDPLVARDRPEYDSEFDGDLASKGPAERFFDVGRATPSVAIRLFNVTDNTRERPPAGACDANGDEFFEHNRRIYDRNSGSVTDTGWQCAHGAVFHHWTLANGSEDFSTYLYGTYDFDNGIEAWASYGLWDSVGRSNTFMPAWGSADFYDPTFEGGKTLNLLKYFTPGQIGGEEQAMTRSNEVSWDFSAGLRGTVFNDRFDWDFSFGHAEYTVKERFPAIVEAAASEFLLGPQLGTTEDGTPIHQPDYQRLWYPISVGEYNSIAALGEKRASSGIDQAAISISGDLFEGWAGPIGFAAVAEAARQKYSLVPDPNTMGTNPAYFTPFGNIEQGGGQRDRYAFGVEFKVPLLESLILTTAARYDRYDAVADDAATTYNAGLEWRPFSNLLIRGTYATSFRAPDMHFTYAEDSVNITDESDILGCVTQPGWSPGDGCDRGEVGDVTYVNDATISRQGTPDLLYEDGESYTAGFVWDIFENFSLSADYYDIRIDNLIDDIGSGDVLRDEAFCLTGLTPDGEARNPLSDAYCDLQVGRVTRGPDPDGAGPAPGPVTGIEVGPINRAETQVTGVDVVARYRVPATRFGDFSFGLNYTNQLSYETRQFADDELIDDRKNQIRSRFNLSASWAYDKWNATVLMTQKSGGRVNNWGGCENFDDGFRPSGGNNCLDTDPNSPTFGQSTERVYDRRAPRRYFNASVGYQATEALKMNLYVNNVFDKIYGDKWCGDFAFCVDDFAGRQVTGEIVYKFD